MSDNIGTVAFWAIQTSMIIAKLVGFSDLNWWQTTIPVLIGFGVMIVMFIFMGVTMMIGAKK